MKDCGHRETSLSFVTTRVLRLCHNVPLHHCYHRILFRGDGKARRDVERIQSENVAVLGRLVLRRRARARIASLPSAIDTHAARPAALRYAASIGRNAVQNPVPKDAGWLKI